MKILITTAEWKAALTCMMSFARLGHEVILLGSDPALPAFYSKFCHRHIVAPDEKRKEEYIKFILDLIQNEKFDVLIPISDRCVEYFSDIREKISKNVRLLLPPKEAVEIARNKDKTFFFAEANSIPVPKTYIPEKLEDVRRIGEHISFPCVVKKASESAGKGAFYANDKNALLKLFEGFAQRRERFPLIQEFINGRFCDLSAVCHNGELLDSFMFEVLRQYPQNCGTAVRARTIYDEGAEHFCRKLVEKLNWSGPIDIDFFIGDEQGFVLLEVNPRFSGVVQFAYECGIDSPKRYLDLILGQATVEKRKPRQGILYRAIFFEEILSCCERFSRLPSFFLGFLNPFTKYDFSFSDFGLIFHYILRGTRHLFKKP